MSAPPDAIPSWPLWATCPDYAHLKSHPFFEGIDWATLHTTTPPALAAPLVPIFVDEEKEKKLKAQEAEEFRVGKFLFKNSDEVIVQTVFMLPSSFSVLALVLSVSVRHTSHRPRGEDQQAFLRGHQVAQEASVDPDRLPSPVLRRHRQDGSAGRDRVAPRPARGSEKRQHF